MMSDETKFKLAEALANVLESATWARDLKIMRLIELMDEAIEEQVEELLKKEVRS